MMVWKFVIIAVSMVLSATIISGTIVVSQAISNIRNFEGDKKPQRSRITDGTIVSIARNYGSNFYDPNPVEIGANYTITRVNDDRSIHTVTANDGVFNSGILKKGEAFSFTFKEEGESPYYCEIHPNMKGAILAG